MDYTFNKILLVILSLSSLLLSSNAVPSTRVIDFISTSVPATDLKSSFIDFTSIRFPAKAPSSIDFISKSFPAVDASNSHVGNVVTKVNPGILKICDEDGDMKKHCIENLAKLFEGPFDVVKALEIEVNATLDIAKSLFNTVVKLRNDPRTDKRAIGALDQCRELYVSLLDAINQTMEVLPQQNFVDAYNYMSSVISYKSACQDGWDESPGVEKPWDVKPLTQSTVICIDILYHIVYNLKI